MKNASKGRVKKVSGGGPSLPSGNHNKSDSKAQVKPSGKKGY